MDPAIAALIGALIGSISSVGTIWLQQRAASKRDVARMATDLAIEEHKSSLDLAKLSSKTVLVPPLSSYVVFHAKIIRAVSKNRTSPEDLAAIQAEHDELLSSIKVGEAV